MILFLSCFEYNVKVKVILKQTSSYFSSFILCSSGNVPAVSSVDTAPNGCNKKLLEATRQMHVAINMQMSATNSRNAACSALFLLVFPATASGNHFRRLVTKLARMATERAKAVCQSLRAKEECAFLLPGFGALGQKLITKLY